MSKVLLVAWALLGCQSAVTEVVVVIDTDLQVPGRLDRLQLEVTGPDGRREEATATLGEGEAPLPRTLTLVHDGGVLGPFEVRARGLRGRAEVLERRARFDFVPGSSRVLTMNLVEACIDRDCRPGTCGEDGCEPIERGELGRWMGAPPRLGEGRPGRRDAGADDGGPDDGGADDGGLDGGPLPREDAGGQDAGRDAGSDAGLDAGVDAGCTLRPEECNGRDDDCDGAIDEDFDLQSDLDHCGACGRRCVFRNGDGLCNAGVCTITSCDEPWDDCDRDASNGCETNTDLSTNHCGTCGNVCRNPARMCCSGTCQRTC
ncbi:MAG: hypothetical protein KF901_05470 [Myxococcales bacterium]|nr:hypothetical protein [Myxococcales bacterium]